MKNWQIMGILIFLIIGTVLISGCTSTESEHAAPVAVSTPTPQIVYVTVLVTPTPAPIVVSSGGGDEAALDKMIEMLTWIAPGLHVIGIYYEDRDYVSMGLNAAFLRDYIDKNLPEMRQLANGATTKKAAALEFVAYLEDLRTASDQSVQAADKYNSGDFAGGNATLNEVTNYMNKATAHNERSAALL